MNCLFHEKISALDLEIIPPDRIFRIGSVMGDNSLDIRIRDLKDDLGRLDGFTSGSPYILGHNLIGHDLPVLKALRPDIKILEKKIIDTLFLSPLAFPENPYHRLVKDYKLVRSSVSEPVEDCRIALSVFEDQVSAFEALHGADPEILFFYEFCFRDSVFAGFSGNGIADVFATVLGKDNAADEKKNLDEALEIFKEKVSDKVCVTHLEQILPGILADPAMKPLAAYCLAWLLVSGSNSIMPPWVSHKFPEIPGILKKLRDTECKNVTCLFCRENHDPEKHLKRFFGFPKFRQNPMTEDGKSLQQEIVSTGIKDLPLLGILPTGGGKSICYQLPALVRHWRRGLLTVVISPLRALMKDQVDNLVKNTGTPYAEAVYGGMLQPERGAILERVRLGDTAILYVSPEQLRNRSIRNTLKQREIGCWVFDEAHCFSKWGHDFRPDYLYASRFIKELAGEQNISVPPVCCYTATAKPEVKEEICGHFQNELGQTFSLFEGGVERDNLLFDVVPVSLPRKRETALELIKSQLADDGQSPVIIYAAKRRTTEEMAEFLSINGIQAKAFHADMDANIKNEIIEDFSGGSLQVICATNAFGMGIDKDNIRLVLHYDMPGSLENYIQEAGRAGRDTGPARCVLLYDGQSDPNQQFRLSSFSEVRKKEIARILGAIRRSRRNKNGEIVISVDELLRDDELYELKDEKEAGHGKVKTAVSWLERSGFLRRNENKNDVFQGKPRVRNLEEAEKMIKGLGLSRFTSDLWLGIISYFFNRTGESVSVGEIAENVLMNRPAGFSGTLEDDGEISPDRIIINALHDMADGGLIEEGLVLSAFVRPNGKNSSLKTLSAVSDLEDALVDLMMEAEPDADSGDWVVFSARTINQRLVTRGFNSNPKKLADLIKSLSQDGKGIAASHGSIVIAHAGLDRYHLRFMRSWENLKKISEIRKNTARAIIDFLISKALREIRESEVLKDSGSGAFSGDLLVSFSTNDLADAIKSDIGLRSVVRKPLAAIDNALRFLHDHRIIILQNGMGIFKQSMTIRLEQASRGRRYSNSDFKPLMIHYEEKRFQVHVMMEYSRLAILKIASALRLVLDYFSMDRMGFIKKYFADQADIIKKATSREMYRTIVDKLENPVQISAVCRDNDKNLLILAGPGSGKTTVIVHRCAYLLLVERIPAKNILVVCFNHNSAIFIRKRLFRLAGEESGFVNVSTYHGLAMRLAGISVRDLFQSGKKEDIDFGEILDSAIKLLKGETGMPGYESDEIRDRLLAGYTHILVDEYQDIDEKQYELVSCIAGRAQDHKDRDARLSILAVGDDDQNIYAFRGANIDFIKRFEKDYQAESVYLVENYRSTANIIEASNRLVSRNMDRMKTGHPVRIDSSRKNEGRGGGWTGLDNVSKGRVQILKTEDIYSQAFAVKDEMKRIMSMAPDSVWSDFAVIARSRQPLEPLRSVFELAGIPCVTSADSGLPLTRIREIHDYIKSLEAVGRAMKRPGELRSMLEGPLSNPWLGIIRKYLDDLEESSSGSQSHVSTIIDDIYEFLAEQKRERSTGDGVFLNTIHSAKGLEFRYVFILGGGWPKIKNSRRAEEERRIMYVAMTRARELLSVMSLKHEQTPFIRDFSDTRSVIERNTEPSVSDDAVRSKKYSTLGMNDIFLSFPGLFKKSHAIHRHLKALGTGDQLFPAIGENGKMELKDSQGITVAKLSKSASDKWSTRLDEIERIRIIAMVRRFADDSKGESNLTILSDSWEIPVCEITYKADAQRL